MPDHDARILRQDLSWFNRQMNKHAMTWTEAPTPKSNPRPSPSAYQSSAARLYHITSILGRTYHIQREPCPDFLSFWWWPHCIFVHEASPHPPSDQGVFERADRLWTLHWCNAISACKWIQSGLGHCQAVTSISVMWHRSSKVASSATYENWLPAEVSAQVTGIGWQTCFGRGSSCNIDKLCLRGTDSDNLWSGHIELQEHVHACLVKLETYLSQLWTYRCQALSLRSLHHVQPANDKCCLPRYILSSNTHHSKSYSAVW